MPDGHDISPALRATTERNEPRSFIGVMSGAAPDAVSPVLGLPTDRVLWWLLFAGVALRMLLYLVLGPDNNDDHAGVLHWMLERQAIPVSNVLQQSYHPPLYYMIAMPFAAAARAMGQPKVTQLLSLGLSLVNLVLLARMTATTRLIETMRGRRAAMTLAALMPQFVIFGLFVSNDTLSFLVGTLTFLAAFEWVEHPDRRSLAVLALMTGIGLLTKGTFLAFAGIAFVLVLYVGARERLSMSRHLVNVALFLAISLATGGYKFAQNHRELGRVIVHNMETLTPEQLARQRSITSAESYVRLHFARMVMHPLDLAVLPHGVPALLYATTWYPYLRESNLVRTRRGGWTFVLRALAVFGAVPTLLLFAGAWRSLRDGLREMMARGLTGLDAVTTERTLLVALLVGNLAVVLAAGFKYNAFSCFVGRLVFPAAFAAVALVAWGYDWAFRRGGARMQRALDVAIAGIALASVAYFAVEIPAAVLARRGPRITAVAFRPEPAEAPPGAGR